MEFQRLELPYFGLDLDLEVLWNLPSLAEAGLKTEFLIAPEQMWIVHITPGSNS
jgi:hypothetical protein